MALRLVPSTGTKPLTLLAGEQLVLGRSRETKVIEQCVSRQHCTVTAAPGGLRHANIKANRVVFLQRADGQTGQLLQGCEAQMALGDTVFLAQLNNELVYGFTLEFNRNEEPADSATTSMPQAVSAVGSDATTAPAAAQVQPKEASTPQSKPTTTKREAKRLAATAVQSPEPVADSQEGGSKKRARLQLADSGGLGGTALSGCHVVFWIRSHMSLLLSKAERHGAVIEPAVSDATTHVVAKRDMPSAAALSKLGVVSRKCQTVQVDGESVPLPEGVRFVVPEFLADSIAARALVDDAPYLIDLQKLAILQAAQASVLLALPRKSATVSPSVSVEAVHQQASCAAALSAQSPAPALMPAVEEVSKPSFTGGDTGIPWGTEGVWVEPFTESAAQETLDKLHRCWHGLQAAEQGGAAGQEAAFGQSTAAIGRGVSNGVCIHAACSAKSFCIVEQLEVAKGLYKGQGAAQFKRKALELAISKVVGVPQPLRTAQDVDALGLAKKTADKLQEILATGTYSRNEALAADEQHQVLQLFEKVWGAGAATAERWYNAGCRTLDDVRQRPGLSQQQLVGLKYFEDFQHRIPRTEVAAVEAMFQAAFRRVLALPPGPESDATFAFVTGSYMRGKPETGDIDLLLIPPASRAEVKAGPLLTQVLQAVLDEGLLVDELAPTADRVRVAVNATWMGVARPSGRPYFRRIDVKVYEHQYLVFAVNYFTGSGPFVRALRHWCRIACKDAAKKICAGADAFKLNDKLIQPIKVRDRNSISDMEENPLAPGVPCSCETDIFALVGLPYVPPRMRYFRDYQ